MLDFKKTSIFYKNSKSSNQISNGREDRIRTCDP